MLQAVWTRRRIGARIEEPKGVGCGVWGGAMPSPQIFFAFGSQNGEFGCILGRIFFTIYLLVYRLR